MVGSVQIVEIDISEEEEDEELYLCTHQLITFFLLHDLKNMLCFQIIAAILCLMSFITA